MAHSGILDVPNGRSSHTRPIPRGGGLAIIAGLFGGGLVACALGAHPPAWGASAAFVLIALCGWWDDCRGLPAGIRLAIHVGAALIVVSEAGPLRRWPLPVPFNTLTGVLAVPVSVFWIVAVVNIYNFLDGIDGYAALQSIVTAIALSCTGIDPTSRLILLALAGSSGGFLCFNWHPARIFMGDVGSTTIGFIFAAIPFQESSERQPPLVLLTALCLWFFLSDGVLTLGRRLLRREQFWTPHRSHLYQRLVLAGVRHSTVVWRVGWMSICVTIVSALATRTNSRGLMWTSVTIAMIGLVTFVLWVTSVDKQADGNNVRELQSPSPPGVKPGKGV